MSVLSCLSSYASKKEQRNKAVQRRGDTLWNKSKLQVQSAAGLTSVRGLHYEETGESG